MGQGRRICLAVDLGASGGRVLAGLFDGSRIELVEIHRFDNGPVSVGGHFHWDVLGLWQSIQNGLRRASGQYGSDISSVGVDTWGVDFALLGRGDELLGNPYHYRDPQTRGMIDQAARIVSRDQIYQQTGLQFMELNTLFQLYALAERRSPLLEAAETFLMMPDFFHWLLTGAKGNELTDASTTQFLNPRSGRWATSLLDTLGIPTGMLQRIVEPGTRLGPLRREVAAATGLTVAEVIAPGTHDTASAVAAVPAEAAVAIPNPNWCYVSSGTWSLMGVEVPGPVINDTCLRYNVTNEGGVAGTIRLLKNIAGLWLVQECRRIWARQGRDYSWDQLSQMADQSAPRVSFIQPDDPAFLAPDDMPQAIRDWCRRTGQVVPESEGAVIRCALESIALRCRIVLGWLEEITQSRIEVIHVVGGGVQNRQLCQMTADACQRPVLAGPVEATALGNLAMQAIALGDVADVGEARQLIRTSFALDEYDPRDTSAWDEALERFAELPA